MRFTAITIVMGALATAAGCSKNAVISARSDSAFAQVQKRGEQVMGVDQYTSAHVFEDLRDGGRIILERDDSTDSAGIATIRAHMRDVAKDFEDGNFSKPFQVHAMKVPGTDVMRAQRESIHYTVIDRPRGAELRISTLDSGAVEAVHRFLSFQRSDHRAAGHEGMKM